MFKLLAIFLLIFAVSAERKALKCKFHTLSWVSVPDIHYTCDIQSNQSIAEYLNEDIEVVGTHASGKTNDDVTAFQCSQRSGCEQMLYLPRGLEVFKNIVVINVYGVGLSKLYREDLQHFDKLEMLRVPSNNIEVLEENLFIGNPNLKKVDLSGNQIKFIHNQAFENVINLENLRLNWNTCINKYAMDSTAEVAQVIQSAKDQCTSDVDLYKLHQENKRDERKTLEDWKQEALELRKICKKD